MKAYVFVAAVPLVLAAAPVNWAGTVRQQPSGAFVQGNPAARVKLVEYLSFTCPHCAHFVGEAKQPLKTAYVGKGLVSVEVRNAVRDRYDFAAALLARCGGAARFFGNSEAIMASQQVWIGKAQAFEASTGDKIAKLGPNEGLKAVVRGVGLDAIMKARGFTPAQIDACLTSKADQERVLAMTNEAWQVRKINGTPSFLINGKAGDTTTSWAGVEAQIKAALGAQ